MDGSTTIPNRTVATMKTLTTCIITAAILLAADVSLWTPTAVAAPQAGGSCRKHACRCGKCNLCRSKTTCPQCNECFCPPEEYCELEVSTEMEERTCFELDYKTICIPKIVPPWKNRGCCPPQCAKTRSVKILKTKTYECPVCKYEWQVRKPELPVVPESGPILDTTSIPGNSSSGLWSNQSTFAFHPDNFRSTRIAATHVIAGPAGGEFHVPAMVDSGPVPDTAGTSGTTNQRDHW